MVFAWCDGRVCSSRSPVPGDYDSHPGRFQMAREALGRHGTVADVHAAVAARFVAEGALPVLDVGCGRGEMARHLPAGGSFGGVALLYVLYHLEDPAIALREARRVARPGGLVVTAAPSRHDSPELAFVLPDRALTFDAEIAPELMAAHFDAVEVDAWDVPALVLPDPNAVRDYLIGKGTEPAVAADAASKVELPLTVTKRGAVVWGRVSRRRTSPPGRNGP